jgi:hypothetical protein
VNSLLSAGSAVLSPCGIFRYRLERDLGKPGGPVAAILGVNPSTADADVDDATIRKDVGFGRRLGWGRIIKGNKFAYRATDVRELRTARDPVGPDNDAHLKEIMLAADVCVAAWGPLSKLPKPLRGRWRVLVNLAAALGVPLYCWGVAKDGHPRHPLMLPYNTPLTEWKAP